MSKAKVKAQLERSWLVVEQEMVGKISVLEMLSYPYVYVLNAFEKCNFCAEFFFFKQTLYSSLIISTIEIKVKLLIVVTNLASLTSVDSFRL